MYGWRAKLALVTGSEATVAEDQMHMIKPPGVSLYFHKFRIERPITCIEDLKKPGKAIVEAAELISDVQPDSMALVGTGLSFCGGYGYDRALIARMQEKNGNVPTTTASSSAVDVFKKLGLKKISLAMPYYEEIARVAVKFFQDNGMEVMKFKWLNKTGPDIVSLPKEAVYHLAKEVDDPQAEAVFISCVEMHSIEVIEALEQDLKKPVFSSIQVLMWNLLRMAGVNAKIEGYGQLLSKY